MNQRRELRKIASFCEAVFGPSSRAQAMDLPYTGGFTQAILRKQYRVREVPRRLRGSG